MSLLTTNLFFVVILRSNYIHSRLFLYQKIEVLSFIIVRSESMLYRRMYRNQAKNNISTGYINRISFYLSTSAIILKG